MRRIDSQRETLDLSQFAKRKAVTTDYGTFVQEPAAVFEAGQLACVYDQLPGDVVELVEAVQAVKFPTKSYRTNGLKTNARGFGFTSRNIIRGDFCSAASLATDRPESHEVVCKFAELVAAAYFKANPTLHSVHRSEVGSLFVPEYRLRGTVFTSGNINKNNPILYHFDTGNVKEVWSGMIVLKKSCEGGFLSLPEFGLGFELSHGSVFLFDGQSTLHGVTPFQLGRGGFRYTVVYYSLQQIWKCLPPGDELDRIRKAKTNRERAVVGRGSYVGAKPELSKLTKKRK